VRYADGRPLWQLSIALHGHTPGPPVPVLRWSPNARRKIEAARDALFRQIGTDEPLYEESMVDVWGPDARTVSWRKPLRIEEVNQMAPTPDVRERKGRP
jgi:hypothetical protein